MNTNIGPAIEARDLHFSYAKGTEALKGLSFSAASGKITGLLGPNGSGKSTSFKILSTQIQPSQGDAFVFGKSLKTEKAQARAYMGVTFQSPSLDPHLKVLENLQIHATLFGLSASQSATRIAELLAVFQIQDRANSFVKTLSGGLARRVELAKALLNSPKLLLLDEPTTGLDPKLRFEFWQELRRLCRLGVSILVTTHLMDEADLCDELVFISDGKVAGAGSPAALKAEFGSDVISIELDPEKASEKWLRSVVGDREKLVSTRGRFRLESSDSKSMIAKLSPFFGSEIRNFEFGKPTLADVYLNKTGSTL